jgi:hypothetical protein
MRKFFPTLASKRPINPRSTPSSIASCACHSGSILIGGIPTPLKKKIKKDEFVTWGLILPNIWKNKIHVPNHKPVFLGYQKTISSKNIQKQRMTRHIPKIMGPSVWLFKLPPNRSSQKSRTHQDRGVNSNTRLPGIKSEGTSSWPKFPSVQNLKSPITKSLVNINFE